VGCDRCGDAGYLGRTGIFEMVVFDEELRKAVNAGATEEDLARLARKQGFRGYREDGAEKVLLGITTFEEVLQAI
jgi:general secretion pathway protein E